MSCSFPLGPDHPRFVLTAYPDDIADLSVCWDSTDVRAISKTLRQVADELDELPEDTTAIGVAPRRPQEEQP